MFSEKRFLSNGARGLNVGNIKNIESNLCLQDRASSW